MSQYEHSFAEDDLIRSLVEGDLVVLKSGGPTMSVSRQPSQYGNVKCVWFDGPHYHEAWFSCLTLVHAADPAA